MKQISTFLVLFLFIAISYGQERKSTKAENVSFLSKEFTIPGITDKPRKVWLYLPPDYSESKRRYPVIYMHDGQNLFDDKTSYVGEWKVDEVLNKLYEETGVGLIVIGIENDGENRVKEYTPWTHEKYGGGKGKEYIEFIVNVLKPFVDSNYRTKPQAKHTALIGSSLGGLISYYGGLEYPNVFGKIGALSTSFWFSKSIFQLTKEKGNLRKTRIYLLVGAKEGGSMVPDMHIAKDLLLETGFKKQNLISKVNKEGEHNEAFWSSEFEQIIKWLYQIK